jgi:diacylglycerol kinase
MEAFLDSKIGAAVYIILFLLFCVVMEWRSRVLNARVEKAMDDLTATNQQIQRAVKDMRK